MSLLRLLAPALNGMFSRTRPTHTLLTNPGFSLLQHNLLGACGISKCSAGSQSPFLRSLLLRAPSPLTQLTNSFKTKSSLKRRCKDCYFVRRKGRLFVICKTHPRHKQRQG